MMSTVATLHRVSVEDYLESECTASVRHEYVEGAIQAMVGASALHNLITGSIFAQLRARLQGGPCHVFQSDMKVRVDETFYYPDVMVVCSSFEPRSYYQTTPILIVEVLSESTEAKDRLEKRVAYQRLESLQEYLLVSQERMALDVIRRTTDGWQVESCEVGDTVHLPSLELSFPIEAFYEGAVAYLQKG